MTRTVSEIEVNIAYRWFLHFNLDDPIPHFATVSYAFATRFPSELFQEIFAWILESAVAKKFVKAETVFIDTTHIKASANKKKHRKKLSQVTARTYDKQLREEINADRAANGKKPLRDKTDKDDKNDKSEDDTTPPSKEITVSTTDLDCGLFRKGEHKTEFAYTTHVACDANNFVLEAYRRII